MYFLLYALCFQTHPGMPFANAVLLHFYAYIFLFKTIEFMNIRIRGNNVCNMLYFVFDESN